MVRNADGELAPLELASRTRPLIAIVLSVDCPYCRRSLPFWRELKTALDGLANGPEVLVLSMSSQERTAPYLADNGLPIRVAFIDKDELHALGLPGVPGTIAVAPGMVSMRRVIGVLNQGQVESLVAWAEVASTRTPQSP